MKQQHLIILLGPPGAGKGSIAQQISRLSNWSHLSTGAVCRSYAEKESELGKKIASILNNGKLIDDELAIAMVKDWLEKHSDESIILDGFPRTEAQVDALFVLFSKPEFKKFKIQAVQIDAPDSVLIERMTNRLICSKASCQKTYASNQQTGLAPHNLGVCDVCSSRLKRRVDDDEETVKKRVSTYRSTEQNLLEALKKHAIKISIINGVHDPATVFDRFNQLVMA